MGDNAKQQRNLRILRLSNRGLTARQIAAETGLTLRHVQRITADMREQHRERLEELAPEEPVSVGRAGALEALEGLRVSVDRMVELLEAQEPSVIAAFREVHTKKAFKERYEEITAALTQLPESADEE